MTLLGLILVAATYQAQEPHPPIEVLTISDKLFVLGSGTKTGGNSAVFITENDGVVLVDTKNEGYGPDILGHIQSLTDEPVTMILNTHVHFDHSGANTEFPDTVHFIAHENIRRHWARTDCNPMPTNCDDFQGENKKYLPSTTFSDRLSLFVGTPDQIDMYYFGRGHTDGDTFIVFKEDRAMHVGDMFLGKSLPFIDAQNSNGGSALEFGRTLTRVIENVPNIDTIINGHRDTLSTWNDLIDYRGFVTQLVDHAKAGISAGHTAEDTISSYETPEEYSDYRASANYVERIVRYVYQGV